MHYSQRGNTYRGAELSFIRWSRHRAACFRSLHQTVRIASLAINVISSLENKAKSIFAKKSPFSRLGLDLGLASSLASECYLQQLGATAALSEDGYERKPQDEALAVI